MINIDRTMKWPILSILALTIASFTVEGFTLIEPLKSVWSSFYPDKPTTEKSVERDTRESIKEHHVCPSCVKNRIVSDGVDQMLNEIRVEYVKQQILKKLRLSKPPDVSISISTLPKPLINGHVLELRPGEPLEPEKQAESFYGKTDQIVVFPNEGNCELEEKGKIGNMNLQN